MSAPASRALRISLWVVQILLFVTFLGAGLWRVLTPIPELAKMIPWAGQVSPGFFYFTAIVDFVGAAGLLLPAVTRIQPWLSWLAALGCAVEQACAIVFHLSRGEGANTPFNFVMVGLCLFVFWGRRYRVPVT